MKHRTLGQQGLDVSAIGLGTMGMTMAYGESDDEASIRTIRHAHGEGVTLFDTAELYGLGRGINEILLGKAVNGFRDDIVIATKFGFDLDPDSGAMRGPNSRPDNIRRVADNSLRYLGTDHLDVLYQHRVDPGVPLEDVAGTVGELVDEGKVRFFGLSEAGPDDIRKAHAVFPVSVLQTEYSVFERTVEDAVLPTVRELGIGFVPYSPLGRGFLTGDVKPPEQYDENDMRRLRDPRWSGENFEKNKRSLDALASLARSKGITVAQLALAWLLAQGDDIVPIPGTRSVKRLDENIGATEVSLSAHDLEEVLSIFPEGAYGARYAEASIPAWQKAATAAD